MLPEQHPTIPKRRTGLLLVNLGTPDGYDRKSMRRYLGEFLSDPRIIEVPRLIWWPILHGIILNTRPAKSGKAYQKIWNKELDESPLRTFTRSQAEGLSERMADRTDLLIDWAMRYGNPGMPEKLQEMQDAGCDRILVFALYPQYSATTVGSVNDRLFETLESMRWMPAVRTVPAFHDDPAYIQALATSIDRQLGELDFEPDVLVASYHGIPMSYFEAGDPYHCQCLKTTRLLAEHMGLPEGKLISTFQSRFGPREWLQPYTDLTLEEMARNGQRKVAVFNPGFFSDCLETLEEINMEVRGQFMEAGGTHFAHLSCLNDSPEGMQLIEEVAHRELSGWLEDIH